MLVCTCAHKMVSPVLFTHASTHTCRHSHAAHAVNYAVVKEYVHAVVWLFAVVCRYLV